MSGPLNYTTKVPAARTVGECQDLLARAGASAVAVMYEDRKPVGLSFELRTPHGLRGFSMPVNIAGVRKMLAEAHRRGVLKGGMSGAVFTGPDHAANVAWRVVKDWLEAQLAIIDAQMVTLDEVMLPWLQVAPQRTLYQAYQEHEGALALEAS